MSVAVVLGTGLVAGSLHVLAGPDHLAAVLPLAVVDRLKAVRTGALWGLGHGIGVLVLGGLGQVFKDRIDVESWSGGAELVVGVMLLVVGVWALVRSRTLTIHSHPHPHPHRHRAWQTTHRHPHVHVHDPSVGAPQHPQVGRHEGHGHSAFGFGMLHGAAGTGHLLGVLPSLALEPSSAAMYLLAYLAAAVASMAGFASLMGRLTQGRVRGALQWSGALSVVVGGAWIGMGVVG